MATKASGTLVLIIEKQHASWGLMCSTLPALDLRFRRQPHIASARPRVGPSGRSVWRSGSDGPFWSPRTEQDRNKTGTRLLL